jgi:hypothetical protein
LMDDWTIRQLEDKQEHKPTFKLLTTIN